MYVSITDSERKEMLESIGVASVEDLFADIPQSIKINGSLNLPLGLSEIELQKLMKDIGSLNQSIVSFTGAGAYDHYIPAVVEHLASRSEFYTSYTPYQAEVSQGTLVAIFEYQTMIARLTGMDIANASMYDGATSLAESVFMSMRANGRKKIVVSTTLHPHYQQVLKTYAWASDSVSVAIDSRNCATNIDDLKSHLDETVGSVVVQSPNFFGSIENVNDIASAAHSCGAHCIVVVTEPISLGMLKNPGTLGADIACGEAQGLGNPIGFGGPMLGFISAKNDFLRRMPGRLVGKTVDLEGNEAYVLTLQAREQHIRRDRATSNICSNQGLCALRAVIYLSLIGNKLRDLAILNHYRASYLKHRLLNLGFENVATGPYFNEFIVCHEKTRSLHEALRVKGYAAGIVLEELYPEFKNCLLLCVTEKNSIESIDAMVNEIEQCI